MNDRMVPIAILKFVFGLSRNIKQSSYTLVRFTTTNFNCINFFEIQMYGFDRLNDRRV